MNKMNRREFLALTGAGIASAMLPIGCGKEEDSGGPGSPKYNVLLVTLDTTRTERLSCYGYKKLTTPNLDRLASQGIKFDKAISTSGATPMAHASILTGLNPYQHGVRVIYAASGYKLPKSIPSLATTLRDAGWQTGAFLSAFPVSEFYGLDNGFDTFDNGMLGSVDTKMRSFDDGTWKWGINKNQRRSDRTTDSVTQWLHQSRQEQKPFFAWVHYWDPHDMILVPPHPVISPFVSKATTVSAQRSGVYDSEVFYVDLQFGRLMKTLEELGESENTIVAVIADHGQGLDDGETRHGWYEHRLIYQEQIRVPFILSLPNGPRGMVISDLVRNIDIFPSILDVLNIQHPGPVEGRSLLDLIKGKPEPPRIAYAEALFPFDLNAGPIKERFKDDTLYCAMDNTWKLIFHPRFPQKNELYNIEADPLETRNVFQKEPSEAERLLTALNTFNGYVEKPFPGKLSVDSQAWEALKALGYVEDGQ
jgi:arylsulfatase A-like enzyme